MALAALNGKAEDRFANTIHAVEHGIHAELLGDDRSDALGIALYEGLAS